MQPMDKGRLREPSTALGIPAVIAGFERIATALPGADWPGVAVGAGLLVGGLLGICMREGR